MTFEAIASNGPSIPILRNLKDLSGKQYVGDPLTVFKNRFVALDVIFENAISIFSASTKIS